MEKFDVLIAGGGPVGLALALDLAKSGASVLVAEAQPNRDGVPAGMLGMRSINVASSALLHRLGVLEALRQRALLVVRSEG